MEENKENYKDLQNTLLSYKNVFQYVYSNVFPEIYCSTKRHGFDLKSNFHIIFQTYKDIKKSKISLRESSENYETISNETSVCEQKPIKVDDFNEIKKKVIKQRVEKRKQKRPEVTESNKLLKKKKKKKTEEKKRKKI